MVGKYCSLYVGGATNCCVRDVLPVRGQQSEAREIVTAAAVFSHSRADSPTLGAPMITTFLFILSELMMAFLSLSVALSVSVSLSTSSELS
jgi:hypothetical protein